jgi:hypothetical protein
MVTYHLIKLTKQAKEDSATTMLALTITPCSLSSGRDSHRTSLKLSTLTDAEGSIEGSNGMPKGFLLGDDKDNQREQRQHEARAGDVILGVNTKSVAVEDEEGRQHQQPAIAIPHFRRPKGTTESYSRKVQECIRLATNAAAKEYKAVIEKTKMSKHQQQLWRGTLRS